MSTVVFAFVVVTLLATGASTLHAALGLAATAALFVLLRARRLQLVHAAPDIGTRVRAARCDAARGIDPEHVAIRLRLGRDAALLLAADPAPIAGPRQQLPGGRPRAPHRTLTVSRDATRLYEILNRGTSVAPAPRRTRNHGDRR